MRDVFIVALAFVPAVALVWAVWSDNRHAQRMRQEIAANDRKLRVLRAENAEAKRRSQAVTAPPRYRPILLPSVDGRYAWDHNTGRVRCVWVPEMADPVRPASQRGGK